jgi:hypothetical protein
MTKKRWIGIGAAFFVITVFVASFAIGCGGKGDESRSGDYWVYEDGSTGVSDQIKTSGDEDTQLSLEERAGASDYGTMESGVAAPVDSSTLPQLQLKVIKTALMKMEADKGGYAGIREDAVAIAIAAGGYVEGESSSRGDEGLTYATITLRVPADRFDGVVTEVSSLGDVVSTQVSTQDVSAEYVDLESRLKHLQAEEAFYLSLIAKAQTIQEMITIQEHLNSIQLEKEQIQGRMNFLDQQIGFSTLTLSVDETSPGDDEGGFWGSVSEAFKSFGRGLKALAVGFFYALPYLLILALLALVGWILVRRYRKRNDTPPDTENAPTNESM